MKNFKVRLGGVFLGLAIGVAVGGTLWADPLNDKATIHISGSGDVPAGKYHEVNISGSGDLQGLIETDILEVSGEATAEGPLAADALNTSGSFSAHDNVTANKIDASGSFSAQKNVVSKTAAFSGSADIGGNFKCPDVTSSGSLSVEGRAQLGDLNLEGSLQVKGPATAKKAVLYLSGQSALADLSCDTLTVKETTSTKWVKWFMGSPTNLLTADTLEAQNIELEDTHANTVRGDNVKIGKGCQIDEVHYSGTYEVDKDAKVGNAVKEAKLILIHP